MITFQSYYIVSFVMPRPLVKVVAAFCRAFTFRSLFVNSKFDPIIIPIRLKTFSLINTTLPVGECRLQDCHASLYTKKLCACHFRLNLNGLLGLLAKINTLKYFAMSHIKIFVSRPLRSKIGDFNTIYTNVIEFNDCLNFDYTVVVNALNVLPPYKDKIVSLTLY